MSITRTTLLGGPAAATFNGHTFFAQDGILVTPALELDAVGSDANGVLDATVFQTPVTIRFTPSAPIDALLALYPSLQGEPGASLFGPADQPLVLTAANGVRLTFAAVAITQMPDLLLTTRGAVAGTVTFLALGARSLGVTATNRLVTIDTATMPSAPDGTPQLADDFAVTWGAAPWVALRSKDGVRVRFGLTTTPVLSDANALLDLTLEKLEVEVRLTPETPTGPDEADVIAALLLQGANAAPGRLASAAAATLDVAGDGIFVRLPEAQLTRAELAFDATRPRVGELTFTAGRVLMGTAELLAVVSAGRPA
jgi:hypothetical protein